MLMLSYEYVSYLIYYLDFIKSFKLEMFFQIHGTYNDLQA